MSKNSGVSLTKEEIRRLQLKGLEILKYFKNFCDQNGLLFYLCGGCCIGALRHKGFIPWDDDVDVFMPRKDYEKLYRIWNDKADKLKYSCIRASKDKFVRQIFITISDNNTTMIKPPQSDLDIEHGVTIDVFPLDGCPSNQFARKMQKIWALVYSLYSAQIVPENHGSLIKFIGKLMLGLVPSRKLRYKVWKFAEKKMSMYNIKDCKYITELCAGPGYMQNEYPKEIFKSAINKEFEGIYMPVPVGYDEYLKIAFGDYMKLPPKEKQVTHHDIKFLDLDNSYRKYKGIYYCVGDKK